MSVTAPPLKSNPEQLSSHGHGQVHARRNPTEEVNDLLQRHDNYFHELELYIAAGEEKLRVFDEELVPAKEREADGGEGILAAPYVAAQGRELGRDGRVHVDRDADGQVWVGGAAEVVVAGELTL